MACGIFLDRGLSPCLLHWQMDSLPVSHQGSPLNSVFEEHKFLILIRSNLYIFPSVYCVFVVIAKNLQLGHRKVSPSSISFVALGFLFRCRIHLELIFVDMRGIESRHFVVLLYIFTHSSTISFKLCKKNQLFICGVISGLYSVPSIPYCSFYANTTLFWLLLLYNNSWNKVI